MAEGQVIDLFSEIDELCGFMDGKTDSKLDLIGFDGNDYGIPSYGVMDDAMDGAMLAVDSSNALLGDPLLNLFDQNELLELQSASPIPHPETLMPVSLTAHPSDSTPASSHAPPSSPTHQSSTEPQSSVVPQSSASSFANVPEKAVRIIVKTKSNMVAPLALPQPHHNLIRIPSAAGVVPGLTSVTQASRLRTIRAGGKLGPLATSNTATEITPAARVQRIAVRRVPVSVPAPRVRSPSPDPEPLRKKLCVDPPEPLPFRSIRCRNPSSSSTESHVESVGSSSALRRKAYELEPLDDPDLERCRRNAINAKKNRELKKQHLAQLEHKVESVSRERDELAGENESLREAKLKLEQQVEHLNNILKNQSKLSDLLKKLGPASVVLGDGEEPVVSSASGGDGRHQVYGTGGEGSPDP